MPARYMSRSRLDHAMNSRYRECKISRHRIFAFVESGGQIG